MVYVPSKNRVCCYSLKNEKDLPNGEKLLTCSRCGEACYLNREVQVFHWPLHKKVCCSLANDNPILRQQDLFSEHLPEESRLPTLFQRIQRILMSLSTISPEAPQIRKGNSRTILYYFQQLRLLLCHSQGAEYFISTHNGLDQMAEQFIFKALGYVDNKGIPDAVPLLLAIPGFANYFLSEEIFLSDMMTKRKADGLPAPSLDSIEQIETEQDLQAAELLSQGTYLAPVYTAIVGNILSLLMMAPGKFYQERNYAFIARFLESWACPYSRYCYPNVHKTPGTCWSTTPGTCWTAREQVVLTMLVETMNDEAIREMCLERGKFVPGLTAKQMLTTIVRDISLLNDMDETKLSHLIVQLGYEEKNTREDSPLFKALPTSERLDLLFSNENTRKAQWERL